ncbi:hypothetical protein O181_021743 [Austropuccinia psidii MF-1]|uniref:Uncharacterized protein n=1 Tax=Austropuccinia psidii MF-1 TaxID=1389203 RepID=A0A9Q3CDX2_9BASI|nr:hypothetical protein [Austropuccinia psidii MF-1]
MHCGHFDPSQIYDGYKAVEVLDPACTECLKKGRKFFQHYYLHSSKLHQLFVGKKPCQHPGAPPSNVRKSLWSRKDGSFGKEFPVSKAPTPDGTSGYSNFKGSHNKDQQSRCGDSPTNPDPEGSDELDGEEVEVVLNSVGHQSSTSPSQPAAKRFQIQVIPSSPRNFQPVLSTIPSSIPPPSPDSSPARPALVSPLRPSPIPQPRNSPMVTSHKLQPVASSSRRREDHFPLLFPAAQVSHQRKHWPIQVTREDPSVENEGHDSVARLFQIVD